MTQYSQVPDVNFLWTSLAALGQKYPSANIDLRFTETRVEIRCLDCPDMRFTITSLMTTLETFEQHLEAHFHMDSSNRNHGRKHNTTISDGLRFGNVSFATPHNSALTAGNMYDANTTSSPELPMKESPQRVTSSEPLVTVHQYIRLDADQAKLSQDHKALTQDVVTLQQTTHEIQTTVAAIYRKQSHSETNLKNINEAVIPQLQTNQTELKDTIQRFRMRLLEKSNKLDKLKEACEVQEQKLEKHGATCAERDELLTSQTKLLQSLHGDTKTFEDQFVTTRKEISSINTQISNLEGKVDEVTKATTSNEQVKEITENLKEFTQESETKFTTLEAKLIKVTETAKTDKIAMQKKFSAQKIENEKAFKELKQLSTSSTERLDVIEVAFEEEKSNAREFLKLKVETFQAALAARDETLKSELQSRDEEISDVKRSCSWKEI